jgi:hypothetical protein
LLSKKKGSHPDEKPLIQFRAEFCKSLTTFVGLYFLSPQHFGSKGPLDGKGRVYIVVVVREQALTRLLFLFRR